MERLLCIVGGMNVGGAETFLMKIYRNIDRTKYQMDFAVGIDGKGAYDDEILSMGGQIFHIGTKSKNFFKNFSAVKNLVREHKYKYVLRTSQHSLSTLELLAAKFGGAKVTIFRSSNSNTTSGSKKQMILHKLFNFLPKIVPTVKLAPSLEAAEFMYGKNSVKKGKAVILNNGINFDDYSFDEDLRAKTRKELDIENRFIVGHIGRFNQQKNHKFIVDIFEQYHKINNNSVLMLVGKGELEDTIKDYVRAKNLQNDVIFTGVRTDIKNILSAMDCLVFPSFYEGMPNTIIEAQASGLPCLVSKNVTKECKITDNVKFLSLGETSKKWADNVELLTKRDDKYIQKSFKEKGFLIQDIVKQFEELIWGR